MQKSILSFILSLWHVILRQNKAKSAVNLFRQESKFRLTHLFSAYQQQRHQVSLSVGLWPLLAFNPRNWPLIQEIGQIRSDKTINEDASLLRCYCNSKSRL